MEFVATKRSRKRKKKRQLKKRIRDHARVEVRSAKPRIFSKYSNVFAAREILTTNTMQANAFWENYTVAQEWQNKHGITWWRSRCMALEHENNILRDQIRALTYRNRYSDNAITQTNNHRKEINDDNEEEEKTSNLDTENVEFNVTEDMLNFFEKSERHRRELQQKRESSLSGHEEEAEDSIVGGAASVRARKEVADLSYGDASPKILAMETALQTAMDRHKDKLQPQYWPNIALKS